MKETNVLMFLMPMQLLTKTQWLIKIVRNVKHIGAEYLLVKILHTVVANCTMRSFWRPNYIASLAEAWFVKISTHLDILVNFLLLGCF